MLQKADAFDYLYKEHKKDIRLLIEKMDKELEATLNYREKLWTESLDMINNNLIKMYSTQVSLRKLLTLLGKDKMISLNRWHFQWRGLHSTELKKEAGPSSHKSRSLNSPILQLVTNLNQLT